MHSWAPLWRRPSRRGAGTLAGPPPTRRPRCRIRICNGMETLVTTSNFRMDVCMAHMLQQDVQLLVGLRGHGHGEQRREEVVQHVREVAHVAL